MSLSLKTQQADRVPVCFFIEDKENQRNLPADERNMETMLLIYSHSGGDNKLDCYFSLWILWGTVNNGEILCDRLHWTFYQISVYIGKLTACVKRMRGNHMQNCVQTVDENVGVSASMDHLHLWEYLHLWDHLHLWTICIYGPSASVGMYMYVHSS